MCCIIINGCRNRHYFMKWSPVIIEFLVLIWSYYVYVFAMCLFTSNVMAEKITLLLIYHPLLIVGVWSYLKTIYTAPLQPPKEFHIDDVEWSRMSLSYGSKSRHEEVKALTSALGIKTTTNDIARGLPSYCYKCKNLKPDRCHHCSSCNTCVLKMDHHCPWVNNCVGFHNYKFFLLFITYAFIFCIFIILTSVRFVIEFWLRLAQGDKDVSSDHNRIQTVVMFCFFVVIAIALIPLVHLHASLVLENITTLERTRPVGPFGTAPNSGTFDLGRRRNFKQVFGENKLLWLLPIFTSLGNGVHFLLSTETEDSVVVVEKQASQKEDLNMEKSSEKVIADQAIVV